MQHILSLALFVSLLPAQGVVVRRRVVPASSGQVTLDTDNLTGTAGTSLHTYNAKWDAGSFNIQCNDGKIATGGVGAAGNGACDQRTGSTWTNNQFVQITHVVQPAGDAWVCVRMSATTGRVNGYCLGSSPGGLGSNYRLIKYAAGTITTLFAGSIAPVNGDVLNLQAIGTTITFKLNGTVQSAYTTTDATYITGNPGMVIGDTGTTKIFADFSAGSAS